MDEAKTNTDLTTTQTGGGNGAAPDGVSERVTPTVAGWWWATVSYSFETRGTIYSPHVDPELIEVFADSTNGGALTARKTTVMRGPPGYFTVDQFPGFVTWIAPIPSSAVCAALAEYMRADADWDTYRTAACHDLWEDAHLALQSAIRAERDGAT